MPRPPPPAQIHRTLSVDQLDWRPQVMTCPCENYPAECLLCLVTSLSPAPGSGLTFQTYLTDGKMRPGGSTDFSEARSRTWPFPWPGSDWRVVVLVTEAPWGTPETYRTRGRELGLLQPVCGLVSEIWVQGLQGRDGKTARQWLKGKRSWMDRARNGSGEAVWGKARW